VLSDDLFLFASTYGASGAKFATQNRICLLTDEYMRTASAHYAHRGLLNHIMLRTYLFNKFPASRSYGDGTVEWLLNNEFERTALLYSDALPHRISIGIEGMAKNRTELLVLLLRWLC
jgi:hypothetical protein